ncbi:chalcone isomerase family protein [Diaphorobacter limosus]|uniref:Chalcone isomerase family protein n=1 Tax=Diaphorobacter limosus TaxID=3036128 RepID=A0ABZ0J1M6_9BURK|nr:chalcone isomerase family protein [Diaphorobacter sp. Y-1]WOO32130.1 chalcone isomerase family protein [Diaphorobacter sp. Y-1]
MRKTLQILCLLGSLCWGAPAWSAVAIAGVQVQETAIVAGSELRLNGAGIRFKGPFKVYVGSLYASKPIKSLDELIAAPGPKRLSMTFMREVKSSDFGKMLTQGIEDNVSRQEFPQIIPGMVKISEYFALHQSFSPGDVCSVEWDPAKGLSIWVKGRQQGEPSRDAAFFRALMSIWLGPAPADWKLKEALLGGSP